jgi:hypothetical protein
VNPVVGLEKYKDIFFQFEHKVGSGNDVLHSFMQRLHLGPKLIFLDSLFS